MCEPAHFNIVKRFLSINDREMKCESGFSLAMASQPLQYGVDTAQS